MVAGALFNSPCRFFPLQSWMCSILALRTHDRMAYKNFTKSPFNCFLKRLICKTKVFFVHIRLQSAFVCQNHWTRLKTDSPTSKCRTDTPELHRWRTLLTLWQANSVASPSSLDFHRSLQLCRKLLRWLKWQCADTLEDQMYAAVTWNILPPGGKLLEAAFGHAISLPSHGCSPHISLSHQYLWRRSPSWFSWTESYFQSRPGVTRQSSEVRQRQSQGQL